MSAPVIVAAALLAATAASGVPLAGQDPAHHASHGNGESLGAVDFPVSCRAEVREAFERGVALLHHMMYEEARATFDEVAREDPGCAMARWGVAMTLFQPLWPTRPGPDELRRGWEAVEEARSLDPPTDRERAYVDAVAGFYREPEAADYWTRIRRFEEGMRRVHEAFPDDWEAAAFYALSHLATAARSDKSHAHQERAAKILLAIHEEAPAHPGAIHYTIHANDVEGRAGESLDVVRAYDDIAPSVPHALHMPTHIFVRLGEWDEVIEWNRKSADAALEFPAGEFISHHYPHAIDYLIYAYLQRGEDGKARAVLEELLTRQKYQETFVSAFHLAAVPARHAVERRDWAAAAALKARAPASFPWDRFPWPEAVTWHAKGLGAARSGDVAGARRAAERLAALEASAAEAGEEYFATQIRISRLAVEGWLAHAEGREEEALRSLRASAELEASTEKHPVSPGALQPAFESLGELLMELDRPAEALKAYERSLGTWPRRFHSLLGAARAARDAGEEAKARTHYAALVELTAGPESSREEAVAEAEAFLSGTRQGT